MQAPNRLEEARTREGQPQTQKGGGEGKEHQRRRAQPMQVSNQKPITPKLQAQTAN